MIFIIQPVEDLCRYFNFLFIYFFNYSPSFAGSNQRVLGPSGNVSQINVSSFRSFRTHLAVCLPCAPLVFSGLLYLILFVLYIEFLQCPIQGFGPRVLRGLRYKLADNFWLREPSGHVIFQLQYSIATIMLLTTMRNINRTPSVQVLVPSWIHCLLMERFQYCSFVRSGHPAKMSMEQHRILNEVKKIS